ncbi:MAG: hypothetical protein GY754_09665 [bacterium]|nr:hypothetical protein [bacterium]
MNMKNSQKTNKAKKDYSGYKYIVAEEYGECIDNIIGKFSKTAKTVEWFLRSHIKSDGVGAWTDFFRMEDIRFPKQPEMKSFKRPNLLRRLRLMFRHIRNMRYREYPWKQMDTTKKGAGAGVSYALFSREESTRLLNFCREQKTTMTSLLLCSLDRVTMDKCLSAAAGKTWLIPLNMRGGVTSGDESGNFTASMGLRLPEEPSMMEIHEKIQKLYKDGVHWGAWIYSNVAKYIGLRGLRFFARYYKSGFIGVYSNIGNWDPDVSHIPDADNIRYLAAGPVTSICPVTAGSMSWRGELVITLQLHPSLTDQLTDTIDFLTAWISEIYKNAGIDPASVEDYPHVDITPRDLFYAGAERI